MQTNNIESLFEKLDTPLKGDYQPDLSNPKFGKLTVNVLSKRHGRPRMCVAFDTEERIIRNVEDLEGTSSTVLLTNKLSQPLQAYCQENHINFIDVAGNMVLCKGNFYVCISGQKVEKVAPPKMEYLTVGMVKTVFALFAERKLIKSTVRDIADKAGVSVGMAQKTLDYLTHNDFLQGTRKQRALKNNEKLKSIWIQFFLIHIAAKRKKVELDNISKPEELLSDSSSLLSGAYAAAKQMCIGNNAEQVVLYCNAPSKVNPENINTSSIQKRNDLTNYSTKGKHTVYVVEKFWRNSLKPSFEAKKLLILADLSDTTCNQDQTLTQQYRAKIVEDNSLGLG